MAEEKDKHVPLPELVPLAKISFPIGLGVSSGWQSDMVS